MRSILLISFIILPLFTKAQTWVKYTPEFIEDVSYDGMGNYVTVKADPTFTQFLFTRYNIKGEVMNESNISAGHAYGIIKTSDNGYLFSGNLSFPTYNDMLVKTNASGTIEWSTSISAQSRSLMEDDQNNFLVAKSYDTPNNITKVNQQGNILWTKTYNFFVIAGIARTSSGYMVGGHSGNKLIIAKLNYDGDTLFTKKYDFNEPLVGLSDFIETSDGGYLAGAWDGYVYKLNASGDTIWSKKILSQGVKLSSFQNYFFAGDQLGKKISKVDLTGNVVWDMNVSSIQDDVIKKLVALPDGGLIAVCTTFVADNRSLLVKIDADGKVYTNFAKGNIYKDDNDNCTPDLGENPLSGILVKTLPGPLYAFTDSDGNYSISLDTGVTYSIAPLIPNLQLLENNCILSYPVSFNVKDTEVINNNFAIHPIACPDIKAYYISGISTTRCFDYTNKIICTNNGNSDAQDVVVTLEIPIIYNVLSTSPSHTLTGNKLTFQLGTIPAGGSYEIIIHNDISCSAALNEIYYFRTVAQTSTTCIYPDLSFDTTITNIRIVGSFDPNDKQVFPSMINFNDYTNGKKEVQYMIRFQNTGNGPAINIKVSDTLSSLLDFSTIRNISTSHSENWEIINMNNPVIEWSFNNINLPYQGQDEEASQGFILFTIDLKDGLSDPTLISNRAAIFFDYNDPILTNDATVEINSLENTEIYYENNVLSIAPFYLSEYLFTVMPNPVSEIAEIRMTPTVNNSILFLFNSKGVKVREILLVDGKAILEKQELLEGLYFYQVFYEQKVVGTGKILIR